MLQIFMQFARKRKQKHCVLFDGHSDHQKCNHPWYIWHATEQQAAHTSLQNQHNIRKTASFWDTSWKKRAERDQTTSVEAHEYGMTVTEHGCMRDAMIPRIPTTHEADGKRWKHK